MTAPAADLYQGERCASCGGDHFSNLGVALSARPVHDRGMKHTYTNRSSQMNTNLIAFVTLDGNEFYGRTIREAYNNMRANATADYDCTKEVTVDEFSILFAGDTDVEQVDFIGPAAGSPDTSWVFGRDNRQQGVTIPLAQVTEVYSRETND